MLDKKRMEVIPMQSTNKKMKKLPIGIQILEKIIVTKVPCHE